MTRVVSGMSYVQHTGGGGRTGLEDEWQHRRPGILRLRRDCRHVAALARTLFCISTTRTTAQHRLEAQCTYRAEIVPAEQPRVHLYATKGKRSAL